MFENARIRGLGRALSPVCVRHGDTTVLEGHAVGARREPRRAIVAVIVNKEFLLRLIPKGIGRRDVRNRCVVGQPFVLDDRVGHVFGPWSFEGIRVHESDSAWILVRGEVQVPLAKWVSEIRPRVEDARENVLPGGIVLHRRRIGDDPAELEYGERLRIGGDSRLRRDEQTGENRKYSERSYAASTGELLCHKCLLWYWRGDGFVA